MIDVVQQIGSAQRAVGTRVLEAGEAHTTTISRLYPAEVEEVWDACTNPERIPRWFLPVAGELRLGGRFQLEGHAGGTILACDPPNSFAATWEYGEDVSWIEVRVRAEASGGARVEIEHIGSVDDPKWAEFGPGAVGVGWEMGLVGLTLHMASGEAVDGAAVAEWMGSDEGTQFVRMSSEGWREAHVAAGVDPEVAEAAAARTTAAYTGQPVEP